MNEFHRLEAVHSRHEDVNDEQIKAPRLKQLQAGVAVVDNFDRMGQTSKLSPADRAALLAFVRTL